MKNYKLVLPSPVKLNKNQLDDLSGYSTITTNSEWLITEVENKDLYSLSAAIDTLYVYMESEGHFNSASHFVESQWVNPNCDI